MARRPKPGVDQPLTGLLAGHHHEVLPDSERSELVRDLERSEHPTGKEFVRFFGGDIFAVKNNFSRIGWVKSRDDVEQRGFARAVRADQSGNASPFNTKRGILDGVDAAEMLIEMLDF